MRPPRLKRLDLGRFGCFGHCPICHAEADDGGFVDREGRRFVTEVGERSWRIGRDEVTTLERQLERAGSRWMPDYTGEGVTDRAACTLQVEYEDGTIKFVHHYHGDMSAPRELTRLEDRIDVVRGTAPYVGLREAVYEKA